MSLRIPGKFFTKEGLVISSNLGATGVGVFIMIAHVLMDEPMDRESIMTNPVIKKSGCDKEDLDYVIDFCLQQRVFALQEGKLDCRISKMSRKKNIPLIPTEEVTKLPKPALPKYSEYLDGFNKIRLRYLPKARGFSATDVKAVGQFKRMIKSTSLKDMLLAVEIAFADPFHKKEGYKHLTPEFMTRSNKIQQFLARDGVVHVSDTVEENLIGFDETKHNSDRYIKKIENGTITYTLKMIR